MASMASTACRFVVGVPKRERPVQRALARVHRQRRAGRELSGGVGDGVAGLAVKPERRRGKLQDRRLRPALDGIENGLDPWVEAQEARGKIVRGRVVRRDVEPARVFHGTTRLAGSTDTVTKFVRPYRKFSRPKGIRCRS